MLFLDYTCKGRFYHFYSKVTAFFGHLDLSDKLQILPDKNIDSYFFISVKTIWVPSPTAEYDFSQIDHPKFLSFWTLIEKSKNEATKFLQTSQFFTYSQFRWPASLSSKMSSFAQLTLILRSLFGHKWVISGHKRSKNIKNMKTINNNF